ncbi:hypothetical protein LTR37_009375 [Vermiconidia calcicola]|uniref:Uncharacterized protein n=1 Tax=Vermiconidia calcicola TaxID=1690605 RepID=A0ACC3N964_9PEZI|nr:hypothetical protein LTR37_009375 [Vermiconidia calcicola]
MPPPSSTNADDSIHVLILGAGLGGLTLAQSLRRKGVSFEIFERDESMGSRSGGWAISIHTILEKLKHSLPQDVPPIQDANHLLPLDLPAQLCFYGGGGKAFVQSSPEQPVVRANRERLRKMLAANLDVQWNRSVSRIELGEKLVKIEFADGSNAVGNVLVGADGANSFGKPCVFMASPVADLFTVRKTLLPSTKLAALPAGTINGEVTLDNDQFQKQLELAHSAYVAAAEGYHLYVGLSEVLADRLGARYYWFLNFYDPEAEVEPYWNAHCG